MKKLPVLLLSFILLTFTALLSNANAQSPIDFGVKAGVNVSNFAGTDESPDFRTGLMVGVAADLSFPLFPIGIETGLYYSQKGSEFSAGGVTMATRLDYLEVPVLAKLSLGPPGPLSLHVLAGPYAGLNINAEQEAPGSDAVDISDEVTSLDIGGTIGVGASVSAVLTKVDVQARYSRGFNSVFENGNGDEPKNSVFTVSVGIFF